MTDRRSVALITGGTAGIGWAFARRLAERNHDIVLVARDPVRLAGRRRSLDVRYATAVETLVADLGTDQGRALLTERLGDPARPVDLLVNNAGFGGPGRFVGSDLTLQERMLDVMCRAVLTACHAALPGMIERGHGGIVNVSSMAAFANAGTYSAAKAWVNAFTEGLAGELAGTGVRALAVCPGFTRTEFHDRAGLQMDWLPEKAWLEAEDVVDEALADLRRGKVVSIPSTRYRTAAGLLRLAPNTVTRRAADRFNRAR